LIPICSTILDLNGRTSNFGRWALFMEN